MTGGQRHATKLYDVFASDDLQDIFIVMEYVESDLYKLIHESEG